MKVSMMMQWWKRRRDAKRAERTRVEIKYRVAGDAYRAWLDRWGLEDSEPIYWRWVHVYTRGTARNNPYYPDDGQAD